MNKATISDVFYTIDIGVNFAGKTYSSEKVGKIITESKDCVEKIITISNCLKEVPVNKKLCLDNTILYYTAGVHPHDAKSIKNNTDLDIINTLVSDTKFVAVGECGLDYNRMFSPKEKQIQVFDYQIKLAKKLGKPLYMHCRDAFDDFYQILVSNGYYHGVVHCFTGNKVQAEQLIKLGFYLGITGWLLDKRRNQDLVQAIKIIPLEKIMVETDAPWLSIDRKRESHPLDTGDIVYEIARLKLMDPIECGKQIYSNTKNFFKF
jgi:TatD DNase family protein